LTDAATELVHADEQELVHGAFPSIEQITHEPAPQAVANSDRIRREAVTRRTPRHAETARGVISNCNCKSVAASHIFSILEVTQVQGNFTMTSRESSG
jgi:hypothetical protein